MLYFVRQGKVPFVPLFIEEIVMEVSTTTTTTKKLICEDIDERNLVAHTQTHTYTHAHTYRTHT